MEPVTQREGGLHGMCSGRGCQPSARDLIWIFVLNREIDTLHLNAPTNSIQIALELHLYWSLASMTISCDGHKAGHYVTGPDFIIFSTLVIK